MRKPMHNKLIPVLAVAACFALAGCGHHAYYRSAPRTERTAEREADQKYRSADNGAELGKQNPRVKRSREPQQDPAGQLEQARQQKQQARKAQQKQQDQQNERNTIAASSATVAANSANAAMNG